MGDNEARLRIILDAINNAGDELKRLQGDLKKTGDGAKQLDDDLKAASAGTGKLGDAVSGSKLTITDFKSALDLASNGLQYLGQAYSATIARAAEWGDSMGDLAALTGESVEDTSRLAATMELVGIDAGNLGKILKTMTAQGLNLNLKSLLELNRQYNAISDPVERNTFLFRNFGRAAEDMAEVMGRSQAELEALAAAADKSGKVIGEQAAAQAEKFNTQVKIGQQQLDGWMTKMGAAGIQAGIFASQYLRGAIRSLGEFSDEVSTGTSVYDLFFSGLVTGNPKLLEFAAAFDEVRGKASGATGAIDDNKRSAEEWGAGFARLAQEASAAKAMDDAKRAAAELRDELAILTAALGGELSQEQDDFYQQQKDAGAAVLETKDRITELEQKSYLTPEQQTELDNLKLKLDEQNTALEKNRQVHEETTARILFSMIQQQYAVDGLSIEEIAALTEIGVGLGIYDQQTADAMSNATRAVQEHGTDAQAILNELDNKYLEIGNRPDITKRITVETHYVQYGSEDPSFSPTVQSSPNSTVTNDDDEPTGPGFAQGGSFIVPGTGAFDMPYTIALTPGERVDVTPVDKVNDGARSGVNFEAGSIVINGAGQNADQIVEQLLAQIGARVRAYASSGYAYMGG